MFCLCCSQKAAISPIQDTPSVLPRFPSSRLRNQKPLLVGSVPSSLNSSSETCTSVSPGTSTNSSVPLDSSTQSRDYPLTPEPPRSASVLTPYKGNEKATKFLSHSNPPVVESTSNKRGISVPPLRISSNRTRHSLLSLEKVGSNLSGRPTVRDGGGRYEQTSFFSKYETPPRIPPTIAMPGRPKEIVPKSWRLGSGQRSLEKLQLKDVPKRRRSYTVPSNPKPRTKPGM